MLDRILNYLEQNGSITTWEAIQEFGCTRLSHYIWVLRKGLIIRDMWVHTTNRYGDKVKYKKYILGDWNDIT